VGDETGGVVHEGDEVDLARPAVHQHLRTVHHVSVPDVTGVGGDEGSAFLRLHGAGELGQPPALQQSMDAGSGELPGAGKTRGADQLPDGAQGAPGILLLGGANSLLEHLGDLGCALVGPRLGDECVDPAALPGVVPPLDGLLG